MTMTRVRKFSGKTVDEATEIALKDLGVELEDVDVRVVNPGRSGILGFGGEPAVIEVALIADGDSAFSDDEFDDSIEDPRANDDYDATAEPESTDPERSREVSDGGMRSRDRGRGRGRGRGGRGRERDSRNQIDQPRAGSEATGAGDRSDDDDMEDQPQQRERSNQGLRTRPNGDTKPRAPRERDEEAEELVSQLLDYFLGAMGVVADTYIRDSDEEDSMVFEIEGQDAGLLIGRRGETLQSLQFLVRMVTSRQLGRKAYVVIDIEDYRERRVQMLRRLARRTAGRVVSSGREDSLEPMSPAERRIVHMSLAGHPDVRTESEGEGSQRRVVIFPK
ncbi:MAG: Jag N-terminal domain-containing protein [Chloroflexi bacterium]|nr:Jag N-terminal domain-containing protein [Chloroflexota bacterium]